MPDGKSTVRDHLESAARTRAKLGKPPPDGLDVPPIPDAAAHLWEWFASLSSGRGVGLTGPLPLSYLEIAAWASLTGRQLLPWEVEAIKALDAVYIASAVEPEKAGQKNPPNNKRR